MEELRVEMVTALVRRVLSNSNVPKIEYFLIVRIGEIAKMIVKEEADDFID